MKLRNKKTGEIIDIYKGEITLHYNQGRKTIHFKCLEDLEEWEDYAEPKVYWYIDDTGVIQIGQVLSSEINMRKAIGNYFSSREEAERAVEKLKAWKRLKDKGFRFDKVSGCWIEFTLKSATSDEDYEQGQKDLLLLFGGEDE